MGAGSFRKETPTTTTPTVSSTPAIVSNQPSKGSLLQIIDQAIEDARRRAQAEQEEQAAAEEEEEKRLIEEKALRKQKAKEKRQKEKGKDSSKSRPSKDRPNSQTATSGDGSVSNKEKRLLKLIGATVVGYLSQWRSRFQSSEEFKRHAKEVNVESGSQHWI